MKVGLIADIHGNAPALSVVLSALEQRVEQILFLGDLVGYYPFVNECAAMLAGQKLTAVRGNHDEMLLRCRAEGATPGAEYRSRCGSALERSAKVLSEQADVMLQSWPTEQFLTVSSVKIAMFHGTPWNPLEGRVYPDFNQWERFDDTPADIVLLGHTHYPLVRRLKNKLVINPGSVGQPRDRSGGACCAELDLNSGEVTQHRIPYDPGPVIEDACRHSPDVPYLLEVLKR
jgi:putative phosphoesterase